MKSGSSHINMNGIKNINREQPSIVNTIEKHRPQYQDYKAGIAYKAHEDNSSSEDISIMHKM